MIEKILSTNDYSKITKYLEDNSNLPGRAANLSLAYKVADYYLDNEYNLTYLSSIEIGNQNENTPQEFVLMCKIISLGSVYERLKKHEQEKVLHVLWLCADGTWRMKEAVAMSFQRIGYKDEEILINSFNEYLVKGSFSQKRAIVAALADYKLLENNKLVNYSILVSGSLLNEIMELDSSIYKSKEFKVLEKGLSYAISVFVSVNPKQGFELLFNYSDVNNKVIKRIINTNLSKKRLSSKHPIETEKLWLMLNHNESI
ncbi:MAG: hypothetical protein RR565_03990 [Erysipelothrix sp.]